MIKQRETLQKKMAYLTDAEDPRLAINELIERVNLISACVEALLAAREPDALYTIKKEDK